MLPGNHIIFYLLFLFFIYFANFFLIQLQDVLWGNSPSSGSDNSTVSMLWGGHSSFGNSSINQPLSTPQEGETNSSSEPPKFSGNMYGLFDGPGSIWDPAASGSNSSLLPWATQSPLERKDSTPN